MEESDKQEFRSMVWDVLSVFQDSGASPADMAKLLYELAKKLEDDNDERV